jgi:hypothetical protein
VGRRGFRNPSPNTVEHQLLCRIAARYSTAFVARYGLWKLSMDPDRTVRAFSALEELLHGTQWRNGIIQRLGTSGAETHVKEFMIRHQRLLGLSDEDIVILQQLRDAGL